MPKFINTQKKDTIDSLVQGFNDLVIPFYMHLDKKGTPTTYFHINKSQSTLDEGSKIPYSLYGNDSPIKYDKIYDFFIYGLQEIITELDLGDWGMEANPIEGEATILPNTIVPFPNDYFIIDHLKHPLLFKVISVTGDCLENGNNVYKISYKLDNINHELIDFDIADEYRMLIDNVNGEFKSIIRKTDYEIIDEVEKTLTMLKEYYVRLFYSERVQTFIYEFRSKLFYDPMMIEFLSKHKLIKGTEKYIYIEQQTSLPRTFILDYDKTFFRCLEKRKVTKDPIIISTADFVDEPLSILSSRKEFYFKLNYNTDMVCECRYPLILFDYKVIDRIKKGEIDDLDESYNRIIYKYFRRDKITPEDIQILNDMDFAPTINLFYNIPIVIFCLESMIKEILTEK